jgi:hypothetical protein
MGMGVFKTIVLSVLGCLIAMAAAADARNDRVAGPAGCVSWSTEAKMDAYGYDHFVHLESKCSVSVDCTITSSTNPAAVRATLAAGAKQRVLIWRGSPASQLTASVTCTAAR